ncbi:MAG: carbon monoxide dehydrogenase subunit G, partial [Rhodospirillales bacterium]|nr:carbon monoxide dehydrogenase subunit G [Rhodospirillales bacterium]
LVGEGSTLVPAAPDAVWQTLIDPKSLAKVIPGCHSLDLVGPNRYRAEVSLGVGAVKGRFEASVALSDPDPPKSALLSGDLLGPLGTAAGQGKVTLTPEGGGTRVSYAYQVVVTGKAASIGGRLLDGATRLVVNQFFKRLVAQTQGGAPGGGSFWDGIKRMLGIGS